MPEFLVADKFVELGWAAMAQVALLGFIGGTLSGFIALTILFFVFRAYLPRRKVQASLVAGKKVSGVAS